jgi:hypothetical protein
MALPDGGVNPYETEQAGKDSQLAKLVGAIRRLKPELVLIPYYMRAATQITVPELF